MYYKNNAFQKVHQQNLDITVFIPDMAYSSGIVQNQNCVCMQLTCIQTSGFW